ncbi:MAG: hypothetical protein ALAOOOJD_03736 [bacterium]|nr:hypothetical protein [bacterium]
MCITKAALKIIRRNRPRAGIAQRRRRNRAHFLLPGCRQLFPCLILRKMRSHAAVGPLLIKLFKFRRPQFFQEKFHKTAEQRLAHERGFHRDHFRIKQFCQWRGILRLHEASGPTGIADAAPFFGQRDGQAFRQSGRFFFAQYLGQ